MKTTATKTAKTANKLDISARIVVSYLRFSQASQAKGDSTRRQTDLAEAWCAENGERLTDRLDDRGVSAFRGRNSSAGALATFLQLVTSGTVPHGSILLVEELDRLTRQEPEEALHLFLGVIRAGVTVITLNTGDRFQRGKIDTGKLMIAVVKFCTANDESQKKSTRLASAWTNKRKNILTKALTRQLPKWLKLAGGKVVIDEERAAAVRQLFAWALEGHGTSVVCRKANKELTGIGRKPYFTRSYVAKILHSRATIGEFQLHTLSYANGVKTRKPVGDPILGYYPAIVSLDDFNALQNRMKRHRGSGGPITNWTNVLKSLVYSVDGTAMQAHDKGYGRVLVSAGTTEGRNNAANYVGLPVSYFEIATLYAIGHSQIDLTDSVSEQAAKLRTEYDSVVSQFAGATERKAEIEAALVSTGANAVSLVHVLTQLDRQIDGLRVRRDDLQGQLRSLTVDSPADAIKAIAAYVDKISRDTLDDASRCRLRGLLARVVARITVSVERDGPNGLATAKAALLLIAGQTISYSLTWRKTTKLIRLVVGDNLPYYYWTDRTTAVAIYDTAQFWTRTNWHIELGHYGSAKALAAALGIHPSKVYPHLLPE